ncbi:MAG: hypothetical protein Q4G67_02975 [Actinomycetia bacterium]|nr:hypothetical protein [Actinomycetes bacterium]
MSTAAAWDALPVQTPGQVPGRRPRLVVIDGGAGAQTDRGARASRRAASTRPGLGTLVLAFPQWLRLAVTLSVLAVAISLAASAAGLIGGAPVAAPAATVSIEVAPGQTLSELAAIHLPEVASVQAVAQIQLANNLPSTQVTTGQTLVIPLP